MLAQLSKNDGKVSFVFKDGHINPKSEAGARIINIIRSYPWVDNAQLFKGKLLSLNSSSYMEAERYELIDAPVDISTSECQCQSEMNDLQNSFYSHVSMEDEDDIEFEPFDATSPFDLYDSEISNY